MALKNNSTRIQVPYKLTDDPAVDTAMTPKGMYSNVAQVRNLTMAQRRKREKDSFRNRIMVDIPVELENIISALAEKYSTSKSQIANLLMIYGLHYLVETGMDLNEIKLASRSMRFEFMLDLPAFPEVFDDLVRAYKKSHENQKIT